jgi:ABC-type transport system involved in multi-copper enzyme maturation permease subunit
MTFLPIVQRELLVGSRRASTFWLRLAFAACCAFLVGGALLLSAAAGGRTGTGVFGFISFIAWAICWFSGVFLTADALSAERREGTLGLLFLTDLRGGDVVLGKLVARSLGPMYALLAVLPILGMVLLAGGVTSGEFWRVCLVLLQTLVLSLMLGLVVSSISRDEQRARTITSLVLLVLVLLVPLASSLGSGLVAAPWLRLSPWYTFSRAFDANYSAEAAGFWAGIGTQHLVGWIGVAVACFWLPRSFKDEMSGRTFRSRRMPGERSRPKEASQSGNPVAWIVGRHIGSNNLRLWLILILLGGTLGLLEMSSGNATLLVLPALGMVLWLCTSIAVTASRFFADARDSGALELLLCTPLTSAEIINGHVEALRRRYLIPCIVNVMLLLTPLAQVFGVMGSPASRGEGLVHTFFALLFFGLGALSVLLHFLAAAWMGMFVGVKSRKPARAAWLAFLFGVLLPLMANIVPCIPGMGIFVTLPIILACRDNLRRDLRGLVTRATTVSAARQR